MRGSIASELPAIGAPSPATDPAGNTEAPYPPSPIAWGTVIVLLVLSMSSYVDRQIISLMIDPIRRHFGASDLEISLLQGLAFALFYVLATIPIGWAVDRYSRRSIIYLGVSVWSLAATACGLASNYWQLLAARAFVGAGEGALAPSAYSTIADLFPQRRLAFAIGIFALGSVLGSAGALAVGGAVISWAGKLGGVTLPFLGHLEPWQFAFVVTGVPGLLIAFSIFLVPEPKRRLARLAPAAGPSREQSGLKSFLRENRRFIICHFGGFTTLSMLTYGSSSWLPAHLMRNFGWTPAMVGTYFALASLIGGSIGFVANGWIVDRWFAAGKKDAHLRYFRSSVAAVCVLQLTAFLASNPFVCLLFYATGSIFVGYTGVAAASLQIVTPGQLRGRVSSLFIFCFNLFGVGLGPILVAFFTDKVFGGSEHVRWGMITAVLVLTPIAILFFTLGLRGQRDSIARADARLTK